MNFAYYWCERIKGEENRLHEKNIPAIKYISYSYVLVELVFARILHILRTFQRRFLHLMYVGTSFVYSKRTVYSYRRLKIEFFLGIQLA